MDWPAKGIAQKALAEEKDPTGKSSKDPGSKLDAGKAPIFQGVLDYFPRAVEAVALLSQLGANKYSWKGWEKVPDGFNRYKNAAGRHNIKLSKEGPYDLDPYWFKINERVLHQTQVAWNELAALELYLREQETRDAVQGNSTGQNSANETKIFDPNWEPIIKEKR